MQKITPFLWFDNNAEEAANFYVSIFKNSKVLNVAMARLAPLTFRVTAIATPPATWCIKTGRISPLLRTF